MVAEHSNSVGILKKLRQAAVEADCAWRQHDYDDGSFAGIAENALGHLLPYFSDDAAKELMRSLVVGFPFPQQFDPKSEFGEPAITVARTDRLLLDVYAWLDGAPNIHQHGFDGAFAVLSGSSLHTTFAFKERERCSQHLQFGSLETIGSELLRRGDVRRIDSGAQFIHSLFHLERPSLTVVLRSITAVGAQPQLSYLQPSIAYDPNSPPEKLDKRREIVVLAYSAGWPEADELAHRYSAEADTSSRFTLLRRAQHALPPDCFWQLFDVVIASDKRLERYGRPVFEELFRQDNLLLRRKDIVESDHRFFLALLINATSWSDIQAHLKRLFPDAEPAQLISNWVSILASGPTPKASPLGVALDANAMRVFDIMLKHRRPDAVVEQLKVEYNSNDVERQAPAIAELCVSFQNSPVFAPLFRDVA